MKDIVEAPDSLDTLRLDTAVDRTLQKLQALGYALDGALLRQLGRVHMFNSSADRRLLVLDPEMVSRFMDTRLYQLCFDEAVAPAYTQGFGKLVPFLRRKVLVDEYNMDPGEMLRMMQTYGPMDWRHPAAHSAYWSEQGVRAAVATLNKKDVDQLNTDRQVIHAMQALAGSGRLSFDPITGDLDMLPDPRFIKAYAAAYDAARERAASEEFRGATDSYDAGYENFLLEAMRYCYIYGDEEQARSYFERWREKFREKREMEPVWGMSLTELVLHELRETNEAFEDRRQFIDAMLRRAFFEGMANNRRDVFARYVTLAAEAHRLHQASKPVNPDATQDRMKFPPFNEVLVNTYVQLMQDPRVPLIRRGRIWLRSDIRLRQLAYDQVREAVRAQAEQAQLDPDRLLPEPPDMDRHRRSAAAAPPAPAEGESTREPPKTIERK
jgi:hypothetical protein